MKGLLLACALGVGIIGTASGVATNYALTLGADGTVNCGELAKFNSSHRYTIQLWFCPTEWSEGASLLKGGSDWSLTLGQPGTLVFKVGASSADIKSVDFAAGKWTQLTLISDGKDSKAIVNGTIQTLAALPAIPAASGELIMGGGYNGRIDEVRLWNDVLSDEFDYFYKNTLNKWNPQLDALVAYYKFDQIDCPDIVEQTAIWNGDKEAVNNHGKATSGVKKEVAGNDVMKYRINGAYTANERFFDRAIPAAQYQLSNDLIILAIESNPDGHLNLFTPNYHAVNHDAEYMSEFKGRNGVMSFDGTTYMEIPAGLWSDVAKSYTFETWFYIDEWDEGACMVSKVDKDGKGITIGLGDKNERVVQITVDGHKYGFWRKVEVGKWHYVSIQPAPAPTLPRMTFNFTIDGVGVIGSSSQSDPEVMQSVPTGGFDQPVIIGKGFKGKLDEISFWNRNNTESDIKSHINGGCPIPGFDKVVTTDMLRQGRAYYKFDDPTNIGFSSYSQDNWKNIMAAAYDGMDGYEIRISVKSHNGWENTIKDAAKRKIWAEDLARLSEGYDGVELDLEWYYSASDWANYYGPLCEEIRSALPAEKSFNVSCHNVAYVFPKDKMNLVDGFTFQQYGPQKVHSSYAHFESMCRTFVNYGFPREKIITAYATTTSKGYVGDKMEVDITGVRSHNLLGSDNDGTGYTPDPEIDAKTVGNYTYYYTGPLQTYMRARHTVDQGFGGIFYWDMGNDVPVEHKYNLAKWASYGLNSNVEPHVTEVVINHSAGISNVISDIENEIAIKLEESCVSAPGCVITVHNAMGTMVCSGNGVADLSHLGAGVYIATAKDANGRTSSIKFVK